MSGDCVYIHVHFTAYTRMYLCTYWVNLDLCFHIVFSTFCFSNKHNTPKNLSLKTVFRHGHLKMDCKWAVIIVQVVYVLIICTYSSNSIMQVVQYSFGHW